MIKIVTMCRQGLVRSVALADVLKLHFEPCDVGVDRYHNSRHSELIDKVWQWARKNVNELGIKEHNKKK